MILTVKKTAYEQYTVELIHIDKSHDDKVNKIFAECFVVVCKKPVNLNLNSYVG